jgi:hypothetical protein
MLGHKTEKVDAALRAASTFSVFVYLNKKAPCVALFY